MDLNDESKIVSRAMIDSGGSFVKALGEALTYADHINTLKIKQVFLEYWKDYLELGLLKGFDNKED